MSAMKVTPSAAMRARDVSRPRPEHLADAEAAEARYLNGARGHVAAPVPEGGAKADGRKGPGGSREDDSKEAPGSGSVPGSGPGSGSGSGSGSGEARADGVTARAGQDDKGRRRRRVTRVGKGRPSRYSRLPSLTCHGPGEPQVAAGRPPVFS